jgi:hypothetical protein
MAKTVKTRTRYKLVGSDYSAQEPRITTFLSGDDAMRKAYLEGKDLYCVIAASVYNNKYEENLEHYCEGTVIELDGKKTVAGSDKVYKKQVTDKLEVPYYYLVPTERGAIKANEIIAGDKIIAAEGVFVVRAVEASNDRSIIYFID